MTLNEIREAVRRRVDDEDIDSDLLDDHINEIYFRIADDSRTFWKWLQGSATFDTVAGTAEYSKASISSDIDDVYEIYHVDNQLHALNRRDFDQIVPEQTSSGTPTYYVEWGDVITLYPKPDDARTMFVKYKKNVTRLSDSNTTILIPDKLHHLLVIGAAMLFYETDEDQARYDRITQQYMKALNEAVYKNDTDIDKTFRIKQAKNYKAFQDWDYQG